MNKCTCSNITQIYSKPSAGNLIPHYEHYRVSLSCYMFVNIQARNNQGTLLRPPSSPFQETKILNAC